MGQGLLVKRMGKKRVIAETGAGQHGMATATMAAKFGFACTIYMGEVDVARQRPNVFWMEKMGATVVPVKDGSRTLKDAINEAFRDWVTNMDDTHYVFGTVCGPAPLSGDGSLVPVDHRPGGGRADPRRSTADCRPGSMPASAAAPTPWASFRVSRRDAGGTDRGGGRRRGHRHRQARRHGSAARDATPGVAQGYKTMFLQNSDGQMLETHSVAAGLDYVGVSPDPLRSRPIKDGSASSRPPTHEVIAALDLTMRLEGIIPALESAHAFVQAFKEAPSLSPDEAIIINMSGRGDKDIFTIAHAFDDPSWKEFIIARADEYRK